MGVVKRFVNKSNLHYVFFKDVMLYSKGYKGTLKQRLIDYCKDVEIQGHHNCKGASYLTDFEDGADFFKEYYDDIAYFVEEIMSDFDLSTKDYLSKDWNEYDPFCQYDITKTNVVGQTYCEYCYQLSFELRYQE